MGKPWVPIEWLAEVIYARAYRLAGYAGVSALVTAALMALHAIVYFNAARWMPAVLVGFGLLIVDGRRLDPDAAGAAAPARLAAARVLDVADDASARDRTARRRCLPRC